MRMPRARIIVVVIVGILAGVCLWISGRQSAPQKSGGQGQETARTVRIKSVPVRKGTITEQLTVYGTVSPAPGAVQTVSVPFESSVGAVMVSAGQKVSAGDILLEIEPSPGTYLRFEQARNAYKIQRESFGHVQQLFDLKLATNAQLLQAKQALEQAQLEFESMAQRSAGKKQMLHSDVEGLINKVNVQEGAIVPAGNPLMEIVAQGRLEVILGVEAEDISKVKQGQTVSISYVNVPEPSMITGRVRKISSTVNPATRLVDLFVTLPSSVDFLLSEYVLGSITVASSEGLIVPRTAVLPEGDHYIIFTVKDSHAVKHMVLMGLEREKEVEVIAPDLRSGDQVIVSGNYQLKDGMSVIAEDSL